MLLIYIYNVLLCTCICLRWELEVCKTSFRTVITSTQADTAIGVFFFVGSHKCNIGHCLSPFIYIQFWCLMIREFKGKWFYLRNPDTFWILIFCFQLPNKALPFSCSNLSIAQRSQLVFLFVIQFEAIISIIIIMLNITKYSFRRQ